MLCVTNLSGFGGGVTSSGPVTVSYRTAEVKTFSVGTSFTYTGKDIGTAADDRYVFIGLIAYRSTIEYPSSVTVAGVSTDVAAQVLTQPRVVQIRTAPIPTGTTADIVVTFPSTVEYPGIAIWAVSGLQSTTPTATATSTADPASLSLNTQTDGAAFGIIYGDATGSTTWTGLTENYDNYNPIFESVFSAASVATTSAETPRTITADYSGSGPGRLSLSAAFR